MGTTPSPGAIGADLPPYRARERSSAPGRERESLELVVRGDRRIVIGADFDAVLLRRLVETVESWTC